MPYMMRAASAQQANEARLLTSGTLGAAVLVAIPVSVVLIVGAFLLGGPLIGYLLVLSAATPFLLLQDAYRFVLRQRDDSRTVAINDGIWTVTQGMLSLSLLATPVGGGALWHFSCWGLGVAVAVLHAWRTTRTAPDLRGGLRFLRLTRQLGVPLLVEAFAVAGSNSVGQFAIATTGGLAALAPIKGAHVALGPVNVVNGGLVFLVTPIMIRTGAADRRRLLVRCGLFGLVIALVSVAAGLLVLAVPDDLGAVLLGETWTDARVAVLPTALALAAYGAQTAAMLGFRAHQIATRSMVLRLITFPIPAVAGMTGLALNGSLGAAYGLFVGASITAALIWTALIRLPPAPADTGRDGEPRPGGVAGQPAPGAIGEV
jgi:hypothetical protein